MAIDAVFKFFANNPPSIAIAGGILMWLVGSAQKGWGMGGEELLAWAPVAFVGGIILQVLWLMFGRRH